MGQEDLLISLVKGMRIVDFAKLSPKEFVAGHAPDDGLSSFLYFKHFKALSSAIGALIGDIAASAGEPTAIESITYDGRELELSAVLKSTLDVNNIRSCGCG